MGACPPSHLPPTPNPIHVLMWEGAWPPDFGRWPSGSKAQGGMGQEPLIFVPMDGLALAALMNRALLFTLPHGRVCIGQPAPASPGFFWPPLTCITCLLGLQHPQGQEPCPLHCGFPGTPPRPRTSRHLHIFCPQILVKGTLFIACIDHRVLVKGLLCIASDSWGHQKSCGGKERQEEGGSSDNTD